MFIRPLIFELIVYVYEKSAKLIEKNLQGINYQIDFKKFETCLRENLGPKNFDGRWWPNGWPHKLFHHILRISFLSPTKI